MTALPKEFQLNNGTKIPAVGMGCWMGGPGGGQRVYDMCEKALKNQYRHFDTASAYANEVEVGQAIRASGIPRNEIYITTKLGNGDHHRVREAFEESLKRLDCEYVDLYMLHWPQGTVDGKTLSPDEHPTFVETYKEMEKLFETGKVKSLGVSNLSIKTLAQLLSECSVVPVTNQVEIHPCLPWHELKEFCQSKGIILTAYSPLGRGPTFFEHPKILDIAKRSKISPAQVLLSWGVQRGTIVVPKSEDDGRMKDNINLVTLPESDVESLDNLHAEPGMHRSLLKYHNSEGTVFRWPYEALGWNMIAGGIVPQ
ncbi:aado/keto reductase [Pluteus cervinus]|uniref:Aado/keto reductase n=1 Tax=Pluteus cervinus TaxID=181527 RepID=A0ACD3BCZ8_9AGAR|nr:aado/keto reductase [Pluteus cervinus]